MLPKKTSVECEIAIKQTAGKKVARRANTEAAYSYLGLVQNM